MNFNTEFKYESYDNLRAYWFLFYGDKLLIKKKDDKIEIPFIEDLKAFCLDTGEKYHVGCIDGSDSFTAALMSEEKLPAGFSLLTLRQTFGLWEDDWFWAAGRAYHIANWLKNNRYCGKCGNKMLKETLERALKCSDCGGVVYPRISPAVIVAVLDKEKILLARSNRFANNMYSVIAGFVEPGETLEECVERELMEEVGIKVKNIRYFGSQPWPFPDSLMMAFTAEYASGEITVDNKEIIDAGWYTHDNLPEIPGKPSSVARKLIEWYIAKMQQS